MAAAHLLFTAAGSLAAAGAFATLAARIRGRPYSDEARPAGHAFAWWWAAAAVMSFTDAARVLAGLFEPVPTTAYIVLVYAKIAATALAFWGLGYYVLFLWTGKHAWSGPIAAFSVLHAAFFAFLTTSRLPATIDVQRWSTRIVFENEAAVALGTPGVALYFLPPIVLAVAYLALWGRLGKGQRRRVVGIAAALIVFFLASTFQFRPETPADGAAFAVFPVAAIVTAGSLLWAFASDLGRERRADTP